LSAHDTTLSSISLPKIGSTVGGQVPQANPSIIPCAVVDQAIALGSQSGPDAYIAKGNLVLGDIIAVSFRYLKSHLSAFSDSFPLDCGMR
jgi:hypothetical protein